MTAKIGFIGHGGQGKTLANMILQNSEEAKLLQAYKDTGLTPEEIISIIKSGVPEWIPKYLEYRQAEEQGLLIKLPCKVGDAVYWLSPFKSGINQGRIESIIMSKFGFDLVIFEQSGTIKRRELEKVFLAREAAEEALKGGEGND